MVTYCILIPLVWADSSPLDYRLLRSHINPSETISIPFFRRIGPGYTTGASLTGYRLCLRYFTSIGVVRHITLNDVLTMKSQNTRLSFVARAEASSGFVFCMKAWQRVTHPPTSPTRRRAGIKPGKTSGYGFLRPTKEVEGLGADGGCCGGPQRAGGRRPDTAQHAGGQPVNHER
jgi:hypothetical protein